MNKAQYKKLSHDIRYRCNREAAYMTEKTGKHHTTRGRLHNVLVWCNDLVYSDVFGKKIYRYTCIGDYETGLIFNAEV